MTAHLQSVMNTEEPSGEAEVGLQHQHGRGRISSIMDMDYDDEEEKNPAEPEKEDKKEHPLKAKAAPQSEEDEEEEEVKEEKKEVKKKEEEVPAKKKYQYKSDGEDVEEELSDEELNGRLSGSRAIQKRFTELDQQKKTHAKELESFKKDFDYVKNEMLGIKEGFSSVVDEFKRTGIVKGNPIEPVYNLLDKMGIDISEFEKAVFFHMLPESGKYLDMDDTGRNAYMLEHENKWLKKNQNAVKERQQETLKYQESLKQENSLKRQAGVSEEQFSELRDELESRFGLDKLTTEQVLEWGKAKPFYARSEEIVKKVGKGDVNKIARILLEFPETTDEWMLDQLGYKQVKEKEVEKKLLDKLPPKVKSATQDDDEADELFKKFRRR